MPSLLAPVAIQQFKDNNGNSLVGGQLYTYQAGTSIPAPSYTDATGTSANTNPVILNSRGEAPLWLTPGQFYKLVLMDASSVLIWSADQVPGGFVDAALLLNIASSNLLRSDLINTADVTKGPALVGYGSALVYPATSIGGAVQTANTNFSTYQTLLSSSAGAANVKFIQSGTGAVAQTLQARIREPHLSLIGMGGDPTGVTACDAALANLFNEAKITGLPVYLNPGSFTVAAASTVLSMAGYRKNGMRIFGAGIGRTSLNFPNAAGIAFQIKADLDWYDLDLSDFSLRSVFDGVLFCLGDNSYVDPLNVASLKNIAALNGSNTVNAVAIRLNYVVNSTFNNVRANCYASGTGINNGTSLECRQAEFNAFLGGSFGNATYGVRYKDSISFSNNFLSTDFENCDYLIATDSGGAGQNTCIGGQFSNFKLAAFRTTGSLGTNALTVMNGNYASGFSSPIIDPVNYSGIRLIDGLTYTTPTLPASTGTVVNKTGKRQLVTFWGGVCTSINVNGAGIGLTSGSVIVSHGQTVGITYSSTPTWMWKEVE